jgi:hypothetical protein
MKWNGLHWYVIVETAGSRPLPKPPGGALRIVILRTVEGEGRA